MRVRFRISLLRQGKRLKRIDLSGLKDPLWVGMRYVTEFKYLEATKWLLISEDSWEKYALLSLVNLSLGQEEQARDFMLQAEGREKATDVKFIVENPNAGTRHEVSSDRDLKEFFVRTLPC